MFIVARSAHKRPTLMHVLDDRNQYVTLCGVEIIGWSRAYLSEPIPQILCLRCKVLAGMHN